MPRVLYFVEGFTDIRFIVGLSEICELTLCTPAAHYHASGLSDRVADSGIRIRVHEIAGGRPAFQWRSFVWLWRHAREFDVILSQEMLRGSLNATIVGALRGVPVLTTLHLPPVEYFQCRRERGQIGPSTAWAIEVVIRMLMTVNGRLVHRCLALGPYLEGIASRYCRRTGHGGYYGVDTNVFTPATDEERLALRDTLGLPRSRFIALLASRISHEKDPETALRAAALARSRGLDVVLLNLGGGYKDFIALGEALGFADSKDWIIGRPAVHPMHGLADYFKAADVVVQASLAEGLGLSTLEALACGTPVVATAVGGMAVTLPGFARLTPRRDHAAMAEQLLWVARERHEARAQARRGRHMVVTHWSRGEIFADLARQLDAAIGTRRRRQVA